MRIELWRLLILKRHIFIIGSKGIPAKYGGYETFVENLTYYRKNTNIQYHIACKVVNSEKKNTVTYHNDAECFNVYVPQIGPAQAIYYDLVSIKKSIDYVKKNHIQKPVFYILACRIGPFMSFLVNIIHRLNGLVYVNPDGHEWLRAKWSYPIKRYWKYSEKMMIKHADLIICDSRNILRYVAKSYSKYNPRTVYIAYGANISKSNLADNSQIVLNWFNRKNILAGNYYLIVGRFVPENNYETMIREYMKTNNSKDLVIITNTENNNYFSYLKRKTCFDKDERIKFVGTVYDSNLLKKIRENAFAYLHGHSVGGTNPSLLEALASTRLNLLFDVGFNSEVAGDSALYWSKQKGSLSSLIHTVDNLSISEIEKYSLASTNQIKENYSWDFIVAKYEKLFG